MTTIKIKEYNLDNVMENYFNTDKEVLFICDSNTIREIFKYADYQQEDFEEFAVEFSKEYQYYYIYKYGDRSIIINSALNENKDLFSVYEAENILIQESIKDRHPMIINRCSDYEEITILANRKLGTKNIIACDCLENIKSMEASYLRLLDMMNSKEQKEAYRKVIEVLNDLAKVWE